MAKLPWRGKSDRFNILKPCILCRRESFSISGEKYCSQCYNDLLTTLILGNENVYQ
jgi:hypothetical protein